jgi:hypothetical protein
MLSRLARYGFSIPLLSAWDSSWVGIRYTACLIGSLLTSDLYDEVLFIKVYSLKRNTIQGGAHSKPDEEMAAGEATTAVEATTSGGAGAGADASDEKSEGHEESLQGGPGEQEYAAIDQEKRTDESEKV